MKKDLSKCTFLQTGGRAQHFYIYQLIQHMYSENKGPWPLEVGMTSAMHSNVAKWFYIFEGDNYKVHLKRCMRNPALMKEAESFTIKQKNKAIGLVRKDLTKLSNKEIGKILLEYMKLMYSFFYISGFCRLVDHAALPHLQQVLGTDYAVSLATTPRRLGIYSQEQIALLKVAMLPKSRQMNALKRVIAKYSCLTCGYFDEKPKALADYQQELKAIRNPQKAYSCIKQKHLNEQKKRLALLKKLNAEDRRMAEITSEAVYLKDIWKYMAQKTIAAADPLFQEISKRTGKSPNFIKSLDAAGMADLLNGKKIDNRHIWERTRFNVSVSWPGTYKILMGKEARKFERKYLMPKVQSEYRGRIAYAGFVKGPAKVVHSKKDFYKVRQGDILVAINTTPAFVPILNKVAGIIAEEGGVTCHVCVISREFRIPAVVGVHHATQLLKDGDVVEVDAHKGIVRRIS